MASTIFYIISNPLYSPFANFRGEMEVENGKQFILCWKDRIKALEYLEKTKGSDGEYGVIQSTIELLEDEISKKRVPVKIRLVD